MRKFNKVLVIVLAVVLLVLCAVPSTFSWFTRPKSQSGSSLKWDGIKYQANSDASSVSMETKQSIWTVKNGSWVEDTEFPTGDSIDAVHQKMYNYDFSANTETLGANTARYYSTAITNSGNTDVSVSLYIPSITSYTYGTSTAQPFYLGVNNPARTYKLYGASGGFGSKVNNSTTMRVYFQPKDPWSSASDFYIAYTSGGTETYKPLTKTGNDSDGNRTYYCDIPVSSTKFFFSIKDWKSNWQRSQDVAVSSAELNAASSRVYWLTNPSDDGYKIINSSPVDGASIARKYDTITASIGGTFNASLEKGSDIAGSITYASSNTSIFTVSDKGIITGKSAGSATLTYTVKSSYNDSVTATCTVTVSSTAQQSTLTDVPIVTNFVIPAATTDENGNSVPTTKYVYWYIKNDYSSSLLAYSFSNLELTL